MSPTRFLKNTELELEHIPLPGAELRDIGRFADTFRAEHREHQTLLEDTIKNYTEQRILPHSLTELRACLALEWAILPHISREPNPKQEQFLRDLVANIRSKVFAGEVEWVTTQRVAMEETLQIDAQNALDLVAIPAGVFQMGSLQGLPLEIPVHTVRITHGFLLGKFPVTQGQWKAVMPLNPSVFSGDDSLPVDSVSWEDAKAFCAKLALCSRREARLPSESEWEYACRAGTTTEFFFGNDESRLCDYAWFDVNSRSRTHSVGMKRPNDWGLCDMVGNVWEWCEDVWHSDYEAAPGDGESWIQNVSEQPRRCLRGGAWNYDAFRCRCAYRSREWKHHATDHFGFRIAISA